MIERGPQAAMVVILQRHEAEGLQDSLSRFPRGAENFRHAVHGALLGLKRNFDEVTFRQRTRQLQKSARDRDRLKFCFCVLAVFHTNRSLNNISKLDPGRSPRRVRLGKMSHICFVHYATRAEGVTGYGSRWPDSSAGRGFRQHKGRTFNHIRKVYLAVNGRKDNLNFYHP